MNRYLHPFDFAQQLKEGLQAEVSKRTKRKYLWLSTLPEELKHLIRENPEVFPARLLLNTYASRQKFYSKEGWQNLRAEVSRALQAGKSHRPRRALNYAKGKAGGSLQQQRRRQEDKGEAERPTRPVDFQRELMAQEKFREVLATKVSVGNGEIRIKYYDYEDLERVIELFESHKII